MIPLFSAKQIREVDEYAIGKLGIPGIVLMENASLQILSYIYEKMNEPELIKKIGVVCGKGNNGGDGFAVARHLANDGFKVSIIHIGSPSEMTEDCKTNYGILKNTASTNKYISIKKYSSIKDINSLSGSDIIIDAMLGSGLEGALRSPYDSIVKKLNKFNAFKVAVDIPTGLSADTGYSENAFSADLTITLGELKKGLFFGDGSVYSGEVVKGNIGVSFSYFDDKPAAEYLVEPEDAFVSLPEKKKNAHKYSAGKVYTIAGSAAFPGAAALTATSSLKIGAGSSILAFPSSSRRLVHSKLNEVVVDAYEDEGKGFLSDSNVKHLAKRLKWADALAIGPGLGREEATQAAVRNIIEERICKTIILDADSLFALRGGRYKKYNLKGLVLTPHMGEFAELIGHPADDIRKNILNYGRNFAESTGAYLVLKGAPTIIFTPGGEALINTTGNPGMAKFGTGDVLTGVIAGFAAQSEDIELAVVCGVYVHSLAADLLVKKYTEYGYTAKDISGKLPNAIRFLRDTFA